MAGGESPNSIRISRIVLLCFAVTMFIVTWAAWPSLTVDCGREMYVPAAMAQGKRLYADLWYPYGPLAPVVNALMFRIFGASLNTLYFIGLAVFAGSALALHSIALRFMPPAAALVCGLAYLAQGFRYYLFNNILPYSCAATFGALMCFMTLLFLLRYLERHPGPNLVLAGVFAALAVISKQELVLPCCAGIVAASFFHAWRAKRFWRSTGADMIALLPGCALAVGVYGWLISRYGLEFLIHANWQPVPGSYYMQHYGSLWLRGTGLRLIPPEMAKISLHALIAMSVWWALAFLFNTKRYLVAAGAALLIAFVGFSSGLRLPFLDYPIIQQITLRRLAAALPDDLVFPQGMYLIVLVFLTFLVTQAIRRRLMPSGALLVAIAMGLMLALKVMMEIRPQSYAIYSSSILFVIFIAILWRLVERTHPNLLQRQRSISVAAYFVVFALLFVRVAATLYSAPLPLIHTPMGDVRANPENIALMTQFMPVIQEAKSRGERVLLLPELTGLYFIAGMQSPTRYEMINPGALEPGKYTDIFLRELERKPADLIILSNRRTSEYGVDYFGLDYDRPVLAWIESHYKVTGEIGHFERREGAPIAALIYKPRI